MPQLKRYLLALTLAAALALGLAACGGGSSLLSGTTASEITSNLDQVRELVGEGDCAGAEEAVKEVSAQVDALEGVDSRLKEALEEGAERLEEVVSSCEEVEEETEPLEEPEEEEKQQKPEKQEKAEREPQEKEPTAPEESEPTTPEKEETQAPEESEPPSGGVGPGAAVGGEG